MSDQNSTYCIQRNFRMLFPTPPTRLNIVSPYNQNFSEFDLNMRRKAEILQYNKPASVGNRGNRMTRKELFAQTTRGFNPKQRTARSATPQQLAFCDSSMNITSTADANVPGPGQPLYLDKNVPLYMFSPGNRNFSDSVCFQHCLVYCRIEYSGFSGKYSDYYWCFGFETKIGLPRKYIYFTDDCK